MRFDHRLWLSKSTLTLICVVEFQLVECSRGVGDGNYRIRRRWWLRTDGCECRIEQERCQQSIKVISQLGRRVVRQYWMYIKISNRFCSGVINQIRSCREEYRDNPLWYFCKASSAFPCLNSWFPYSLTTLAIFSAISGFSVSLSSSTG